MFCKSCGNQMEDGAICCPKCGTSQSGAATPQSAPKQPLWESLTLENLADDMRKVYEDAGWEFVGTDSHQEILTTRVGNEVRHTSREVVKTSLRRNKNMPNYARIKELSDIFIKAYSLPAPTEPTKSILKSKAPGVPLFTILGAASFIFVITIPLSIVFFIIAVKKAKSGYKRDMEQYPALCARYDKVRTEAIKYRAECVNLLTNG